MYCTCTCIVHVNVNVHVHVHVHVHNVHSTCTCAVCMKRYAYSGQNYATAITGRLAILLERGELEVGHGLIILITYAPTSRRLIIMICGDQWINKLTHAWLLLRNFLLCVNNCQNKSKTKKAK